MMKCRTKSEVELLFLLLFLLFLLFLLLLPYFFNVKSTGSFFFLVYSNLGFGLPSVYKSVFNIYVYASVPYRM